MHSFTLEVLWNSLTRVWMAWTKALLRGLFDFDVDGVGKESFRNRFRGPGTLALSVEGFWAGCAPHADVFTARFLSEMESLVLLALKLLDKRYQTLMRWTMRSCAYRGWCAIVHHLRITRRRVRTGSPHAAEARGKREAIWAFLNEQDSHLAKSD